MIVDFSGEKYLEKIYFSSNIIQIMFLYIIINFNWPFHLNVMQSIDNLKYLKCSDEGENNNF